MGSRGRVTRGRGGRAWRRPSGGPGGRWRGRARAGVAVEPALRARRERPQAAGHLRDGRTRTGLDRGAGGHGRCRRRPGRGRHTVLGPGHGRPHHPGGVGPGPGGRGHSGRHPGRGARRGGAGPAGGHDLLQPGVPGRPRSLRPHAGAKRRARRHRSRHPARGVGAVGARGRRRRAWTPCCWPRR